MYYTSSSDGGLTWEAVKNVNIATGAGQLSRYVDIHANGTNIYLAGRSVELTFFGLVPHFRLFYVQSTNGGTSWSNPQVLAEFGDLFSGGWEYGLSLSGVGDRLYLGYEHAGNLYFRWKDTGSNWSAAQTIGPGAWPSLTQDASGKAWLIWDEAGTIKLRQYDGINWGTIASLGGGSYPNLKAGASGGSIDWVTTQCSGAPFRLSVSGQPAGSNQPPTANPGDSYTGIEDLPISFDGTASSDPDGDALSYAWDFGDGATGSGATPSHAYTYGDTFTVSLTVTDGKGGISQATTTATVSEVNDLPVANAGGPYSGEVGSPISLDGSASYDPDNQDGTLVNDQTLSYSWDFGDGFTGSGVNLDHTYTAAGDYTATLTVSDGVDFSIAQAQVSISSVNQSPVADDVAISGPAGSDIPWMPSVSDPEGDSLTCSIVGLPGNGSATVEANCASGVYSPNPGFVGTDTLTYQACETSTLEGLCSSPATVTVTVNPPPSVHVGDLEAFSYSDKRYWTAKVTITVHDENDGLVIGATVKGIWNGDVTDKGECGTVLGGQCSISKDKIRKNISSATFTVTDIVYDSAAYQPSANHDADNDSDGTFVVISKP